MVSIGSIPPNAPKDQPWKGLDGNWCAVCKACGTLNIYPGTAGKKQPPIPIRCQRCDTRAVQREQRRLQRQEEAAKKRWGS